MSQDVLRQIQGLQGCREPHSSRWRFGLETLEEETIFENGWMRVNKLDFLFDLGKRSFIFVEKSRTGLPSKGEVWSGDPVVCDGMYEWSTCQMWKLNLSWKWNLIISKVGWFEGLKLENWWKTEDFFHGFPPTAITATPTSGSLSLARASRQVG